MDPMADAMAVATPSSDGLSAANWTIFTDIYNLVDTPLEGAINSIISALTGYISGPLKYLGGNPALGNTADYSANRRGVFVASSVWGSLEQLALRWHRQPSSDSRGQEDMHSVALP